MKKLISTCLLLLALQSTSFAVDYKSIYITKYNLSATVANSYIRGVIAQGDITRWNTAHMPIKVYIQTRNVPPEYVEQIKKAYMDWQKVTHGQVKFALVNSPQEADTKCLFMHEIPNTSEDTLGVHLFKYDENGIADSTITFHYTNKYGQYFSEQQIYATALHEIGHSLGLAGHSSNPNDLMYPVSSESNPTFSKRDLTTFKLLYLMVPDNTNIPLTDAQKRNLYTKAQVVGGENRLMQDAETAAKINRNITPQDPNTRIRLAYAYQKNGNYKAAITEYKAAIPMIDSDEVKSLVYCGIAECYIKLKNYTAARNCSKYVNTHYPTKHSIILPAMINYEAGQKMNAVKELVTIWNDSQNQNAGAMLKEIYMENQNSDNEIKKYIERNMRL